jgi:hypothetical protein
MSTKPSVEASAKESKKMSTKPSVEASAKEKVKESTHLQLKIVEWYGRKSFRL